MPDNGVEILLVEDNPNDEKLTVHALTKCDIAGSVYAVRDGEEALEYLFRTGVYADRSSENPRLILLDLKLPQIDGIEVLSRIRQDRRTRWIPVVMLATSTDERDILRSYEQCVSSYVVKPDDIGEYTEVARYLKQYWLHFNRQPGPVNRSSVEGASLLASTRL